MKKMSLMLFIGLLTSSYTFSALIPRTARAMTRYYSSATTPCKSPSFVAKIAGGLGGALVAVDLLALGLHSYPNIQSSKANDRTKADDRKVILLLNTIVPPAGMYGGLRIVGVPRSPAAAAAFTGVILMDIALCEAKISTQ